MKRALCVVALSWALGVLNGVNAAPPATVDELKAMPDFSTNIAYEVALPRYGFFIHAKGYLVGLHQPDGKILFDKIGDFILQRQVKDSDGKVSHEHAGWIHDENVTTTIQEETMNGAKGYVIAVTSKNLKVTWRLRCADAGLEAEVDFEAVDFPEEGNLSALFGISFNKANLDTSDVSDTSNPVVLYAGDSRIDLSYGSDFKPYNDKGPACVVDGGGVRFYPFNGRGAVANGTVIPLTFTIAMPSVP